MDRKLRTLVIGVLIALPVGGCGSSNPYQGMTDQELYALGLQRYERGNWDDAIHALDRLLLTFGGSDVAPEARLLLAHARFAKGDYLSARSDYQRFLDRYPGHQDAAVAALGICRSLAELSPNANRDQAYTNDALGICRNVVVDYASTPQAAEAAQISNTMRLKLAEHEYLAADFYFRRELFDSAIRYFEFVARLYPETEWAPKALLGIYRSNVAIGYDDLADEARQRLLQSYPDSPAAAEVRSDGPGA